MTVSQITKTLKVRMLDKHDIKHLQKNMLYASKFFHGTVFPNLTFYESTVRTYAQTERPCVV
jgi:hypothetical protein